MNDFRYQEIIHHAMKQQLCQEKEIILKVLGDSMHPLMKEGESIRVESFDPNTVSVGDIITFEKEDTYITHRLLWTKTRDNGIELITRGDNEINIDPPVSPDHVLGKVAALQRGSQTLQLKTPFWRFMNRLLGIIFLVETICILFYRSRVGPCSPLRTFVPARCKPSHPYRHLRNRVLRFVTGIIF